MKRTFSVCWLFYAFLGLLVWLPIPLGSNRPWAWSLMEAWVFVLGALWLWGYIRGSGIGDRGTESGEQAFVLTPVFLKAKPVLILFAVWLGYLLLQMVPLPVGLVSLISPEAGRMHGLVDGMGNGSGWVTLSVAPHASAVFWLQTLAYVVIFCLMLLLVRSRRRLQLLAYTLVYAGLVQALYAATMHLAGVEYVLFIKKYVNIGHATGTFINRNHLSFYLVMCLSVGIGLLIAQLGGSGASTWRQRLRSFIHLLFSAKMRLRLYLAVMVVALVLTHSRMGNTAFFASLMIAGAIGLALSRHATRSTMILLASLIIIDIFIVGTWFGVDKVAKRLSETTFAASSRDEVNVYGLEQLGDYPGVGSGTGSFYPVFPRYRQEDVGGFYDHAHNEYLEFATDTGILGLGILGLAVIYTLAISIIAQYRRRDPLMRGMSFAAIMGIMAMLIHSGVEFVLHIPVNAVMVMVLMGLGWISAFGDRR